MKFFVFYEILNVLFFLVDDDKGGGGDGFSVKCYVFGIIVSFLLLCNLCFWVY